MVRASCTDVTQVGNARSLPEGLLSRARRVADSTTTRTSVATSPAPNLWGSIRAGNNNPQATLFRVPEVVLSGEEASRHVPTWFSKGQPLQIYKRSLKAENSQQLQTRPRPSSGREECHTVAQYSAVGPVWCPRRPCLLGVDTWATIAKAHAEHVQ